jgi:hypothetical protein
MVTRTIQLLGQGYGPSPADITVTLNGNTVFSGTISTVDQPVPSLPTDPLPPVVVLCTFATEQDFWNYDNLEIPMTCEVNNGTVIFAEIFANYATVSNTAYTQEQLATLNNPNTPQSQKVALYETVATPPFTQEEIDTLLNPATPENVSRQILWSHSATPYMSSGPDSFTYIGTTDARNDVEINGVPQTPDRSDLPGTWWWTINNGSTLAYNLDLTSPVAPFPN